jgi:tRNA threonylcarbamoyladenosine biosynthesis protein TsaE
VNKISKNIKDTEKIAKDFLDKLTPIKNGAVVVGLYGDLGTGKTTFTQNAGKYFGIKRKINSPTFVIIKKYEISKKRSHKNFLADKTKPVSAGENFHDCASFKYLFHIDAYRLKNEKELLNLGWLDIISNPEHLVFIEWPENIIKAMPKKHHKIGITHTKEGHRSFKIKKV